MDALPKGSPSSLPGQGLEPGEGMEEYPAPNPGLLVL